jgi:UDP-N-acetylmuramoylalanine--D-glutamate ligase
VGRLVILGAGESGIGAARLARKNGESVLVSDNGPISAESKEVLYVLEVEWEENGHDQERVLLADCIIKSPGIPDHVPIVKLAREKGIEVISETEYASRYTTAKLIGITGSNGKTTTATLLHHILHQAGLNVELVGNVGKSFAAAVAEGHADMYVIELSSFQLDGSLSMKLDIAILLNITPDHLDRYDNDFQKYVESKFRITLNQTKEDCFIYCADDKVITEMIDKNIYDAMHLPFSISGELEEGAFLKDETLVIKTHNTLNTMSIYDLALQGKHNLYNSMAAGIATRILEVSNENVRESLSDFQNIEHRLELVTTIEGVEYINDSKATNVNATWYALESVRRPIIWIVGGVDKGNKYAQLQELVAEKVKCIICLGEDNKKIKRAFGKHVDQFYEVTSAAAAVRTSQLVSERGDTVLLSPACASFDLFKNYEDRGHKFKRAVRAL